MRIKFHFSKLMRVNKKLTRVIDLYIDREDMTLREKILFFLPQVKNVITICEKIFSLFTQFKKLKDYDLVFDELLESFQDLYKRYKDQHEEMNACLLTTL